MPLIQHGIAHERTFTFVPPGRVDKKKVHALGEFAPDGRRYEVCPMCSCKASLRAEIRDDGGALLDTVWECEQCGYKDSDKLGPLN